MPAWPGGAPRLMVPSGQRGAGSGAAEGRGAPPRPCASTVAARAARTTARATIRILCATILAVMSRVGQFLHLVMQEQTMMNAVTALIGALVLLVTSGVAQAQDSFTDLQTKLKAGDVVTLTD